MFSRTNKAERTATQAWDYLSSAMAAAGDSARDAGKHTADVASAKASEFSDRAGKTGAKLADRANRQSTALARKASKRSSALAGRAGHQSSRIANKATHKGAKLADKASSKVNSATDEAWTRANAAANALAGRKPGLPWGLILGVGLLGTALGWAAATTARAALERQAENEQLELAETAVVITPAYED